MINDCMTDNRIIGMIQPKKTGSSDRPDLYNVGFPIAEFHENGDFLISKPKNTGGLVNKATITEQLLYETHNPNQYIVPDVVADMSELNLIEEAPNRVLVKGAVGHKKPDLLKATICSESGFIGEAEMSYAGPNSLQRAKLAIEVIEKRIQKIGLQGKTRFDIIGAGSVHFSSSEKNGRKLFSLCFLISSIRFFSICFILLYFKK